MNFWLKHNLDELRAIPLDDRLSDDAVIALMHMHLSVAGLLADGLPEDGSATVHREALEQLFGICDRRSRSNQSLARRSRMIPALYRALYIPDTPFDERKHDRCLNRSFGVVDAWRKQPDVGGRSDERTCAVEYGVLHGIIEAFAFAADQDKASDEDFRYMQRRLSEWVSEMIPDGNWDGLSDDEAVCRLNILTGYANLHADARFDQSIDRARNRYSERILRTAQPKAETLFYLYRISASADDAKAEAIAERARCQADRHPQGSDERLWLLAICLDCACGNMRRARKRQRLGHSA